MDYHSYTSLSDEELKRYNSIWVWCNKCNHKHMIGTDISSNHSNNCQLIPKEYENEDDHCWKYIGYIYENVYTISKNDKHIKVDLSLLPKIKQHLTEDWKDWLIIGEMTIYQCIICKMERKELEGLIGERDLQFKIDNNLLKSQERKEVKKVLNTLIELKNMEIGLFVK